MNKVQLVIGNKNYSSWSFRAWLCLRKSGAQFDELLLPLDTPEFEEKIGDYSPSRRVPALWDDGQCIWDSLAICEYVNERFAGGSLWPEDPLRRGLGRAMAAEMHSGFPQLRNKLPMNCRASNRIVEMDANLQADIDRVFALWGDSRVCHADKGSWLLGEFSIADAMFAPVVLRLGSYDIPVPEDIQIYCEHLRADPDVQLWIDAALKEPWVVAADEAGTEQPGA
jgi:glutathione S-transferase